MPNAILRYWGRNITLKIKAFIYFKIITVCILTLVTLLPKKNSRRLFVCLPYSFWIGGCLQFHICLNCTLASYFKPSCPYLLCSIAMFYGFKFYGFFVLFFYFYFFLQRTLFASSCFFLSVTNKTSVMWFFAPFLFSCLSASTSALLSPQSNISFAKAVLLLVVSIYFYTELWTM